MFLILEIFRCQNVDTKKIYNDEKDTIHGNLNRMTRSASIRNRILELLHSFRISRSEISSEVEHEQALAQKQCRLGMRGTLNEIWL